MGGRRMKISDRFMIEKVSLIGRLGVRKIQAVPSTALGILKFPVPRGILTLWSSRIILLECTMVSGPEARPPDIIQAVEERIKVAIHLEYPEQTIAIGSTLTKEGRKTLCDLLRRSLDVFSLKPADMTGVPRHIAEHKLNVREGCSQVRQKKRSQAPKRNKAIQEEVEKLVDVSIMKEVHYHSWLSNPVMVKKHDDSWRMCVDFKDLNKACPKDGYPLSEIDWKVESLGEYPFMCFLDAYKGYHQMKIAKEDEEKTTFITSQGVFCYSKMNFGLKNARATYQRLVDKAFQKQIGRNLEVYVDDLVIKSRTKHEIIRDMEETLKTLMEINMKLNPKKYTFRIEEGTFLGYKVNTEGIMTAKAKVAFKEMKKLIAELPTLTAPMEREELIVYLAAAREAVSAILITEREAKQMPVYFVSRALFGATNNEAEYEALIAGLRIAKQMGVKNLQANVDSRLVDNQVMVKELKEKSINEAEEKARAVRCKSGRCKKIDKSKSRLASSPPRAKKPTAKIDSHYVPVAVLRIGNRLSRTLPGGTWKSQIPNSSNGILYKMDRSKACRNNNKDDPFEERCEKLCIRQCFTSVKHPQANGLVERANRSLGEGIKERLDERSKDWIEELPHVLWAHRTMIKSSNGDTPFSFTYRIEVVILVEIGMPTMRTAEVDMVQNDEALEIKLDLLQERREQAAICEVKSKAKIKKYYSSKVRNISFKLGDLVYRSNEASHAKESGKLSPKWEGPYEVTKALGNRAYKLRDCNGKLLPRTWNVRNLKKCYVHEM
ncbi:reverse transcriptase domain-containing protein [Tanacetum coccineum]